MIIIKYRDGETRYIAKHTIESVDVINGVCTIHVKSESHKNHAFSNDQSEDNAVDSQHFDDIILEISNL